jgi:hypothetical protein
MLSVNCDCALMTKEEVPNRKISQNNGAKPFPIRGQSLVKIKISVQYFQQCLKTN